MPQAPRGARIAVAVLFFTNGAIFANLVPRYPSIKADLELTDVQYGVAIAAFPAGALLAGLAAGMLVRRFRSSRVAVAGTALVALGLLAAGVAPNAGVLAIALLLGGAADALVDVVQNAHGLRVQRRYGRSILNGFHAVWSIGAVSGGLMGAGAAALGTPRALHLGLSAALFICAACACYRHLLPGPEQHRPGTAAEERAPAAARGRWPRIGILAALVVIAAGCALVEDAGSSWAAVYLARDLGAPLSLAALGFVALTGAQCAGRLLGDRLVDRFGQRAVARAGGTIAALGMGLALALPTVSGTIAGFACAGFGVATLVPAAMHGADSLPGLRPGSGLAIVSWLMRLGFLLSPPVIGLIAEASSLRVGLLAVPLAGVTVILAARVLDNRRVSR